MLKSFFLIFCLLMEGSGSRAGSGAGSGSKQKITNSDPSGPKTYGSEHFTGAQLRNYFRKTFSPPPFLLSGKDVRGPEVCPPKILHKQVQGAAWAEIHRCRSYKGSGKRLLRETVSQILLSEFPVRLHSKKFTEPIKLDIAPKTYPLGQHLFISASNNMFYHHSQ